jgi:hypothetical protein
MLSYKKVKKGSLKKLWKKATVLSPNGILSALVSRDCLRSLRRILRKNTDVMVAPEDLVNGIRKLLNENAAVELSKINVDFYSKRRKTQKTVEDEQAEQPESSKPSPNVIDTQISEQE